MYPLMELNNFQLDCICNTGLSIRRLRFQRQVTFSSSNESSRNYAHTNLVGLDDESEMSRKSF